MTKTKIILGIGITFFIVVIIWALTSDATEEAAYLSEENIATSTSSEAADAEVKLSVPPQSALDVVLIESVTLTQPGFVAVRAVYGDRLGQIIEISEYLKVGIHTNITITLGDFYEGDEELIVMVYEDAGGDQVFNDLDQPVEVAEVPIAAYVATGKPVPPSITATPEGISMMDMGSMAMISYTDSGFEPKDISVSLGTMVHFVNESSRDMWVASDAHPAHTDLPTFDQFVGGKPGEQYIYIFDQVGVWNYHDHLNPTAVGTITVNK